jgi:hypothetical protein
MVLLLLVPVVCWYIASLITVVPNLKAAVNGRMRSWFDEAEREAEEAAEFAAQLMAQEQVLSEEEGGCVYRGGDASVAEVMR